MATNRDTDYRTSAEGTTSRDVDYHDRLEQEVTQLKKEVAELITYKHVLEGENLTLDSLLKQAHAEIAQLRLVNEQLRQAIAVLNDEPTNSL